MIYVTILGLFMLAISLGFHMFYWKREVPMIADYLAGLGIILILGGLFAGKII